MVEELSFGSEQSVVALAIFAATYAALSLRNLRGARLPIWLILLLGAASMVLTGSISVPEAYAAINLQVLVFLFSMFVLVTALDISGALEGFATRLLARAGGPDRVLYLTFFGFALLSSVLMNDTIALMGTPIMVTLARRLGVAVKPLLLTLAFAITIGSVMTPMGNPQNVLVAVSSGMNAPVVGFAYYLAIPTAANLLATAGLLRFLFRKQMRSGSADKGSWEKAGATTTAEVSLARRTTIVVVLTIAAVVAVNAAAALGTSVPFGISEVSLFGAALMLAVSGRARDILREMDWGILVLFAALFVLMQGVSLNGVISYLAGFLPSMNPANPPGATVAIVTSSVLLSQVLSNVPMVGLYIPLMKSLGFGPAAVYAWAALAGGSTIAGNLTLLGAASNLIIVEQAERAGCRLSFLEFAKVGVAVTALNVAILYAYLYFV